MCFFPIRISREIPCVCVSTHCSTLNALLCSVLNIVCADVYPHNHWNYFSQIYFPFSAHRTCTICVRRVGRRFKWCVDNEQQCCAFRLSFALNLGPLFSTAAPLLIYAYQQIAITKCHRTGRKKRFLIPAASLFGKCRCSHRWEIGSTNSAQDSETIHIYIYVFYLVKCSHIINGEIANEISTTDNQNNIYESVPLNFSRSSNNCDWE